jgi:hypothetical protein
MRATTGVILGAGLLIGGLVFAALIPPDETAHPAGGAAGQAGIAPGKGSPIDDLVEESLRHAHEADAAIADGRLRMNPNAPPIEPADATRAFPADADPKTAGWQPPTHDLPQGVYFDEKTLLLIGPRWAYEWRVKPGGGDFDREPAGAILYGFVPKIAMGYISGEYFVRWAAGDGWLPNDVAGPQRARRRTRLRRRGAQICAGERCLQYASASPINRSNHPLWDSSMPDPKPALFSHLGPLSYRVTHMPQPTGLPRYDVSFSVIWIDAHRAPHIWGSRSAFGPPQQIRHIRHPPLVQNAPQPASKVMPGWPRVTPDQVQCVCVTGECAPDDRSPHVVAAQRIGLWGIPLRGDRWGLPMGGERWRCDRPDAQRRWSLKPLGLKGEVVLEEQLYKGRSAGTQLRLPKPMTTAPYRSDPSAFEVRDVNRTVLLRFEAQMDGTLKARKGAQKAVILPALPTKIR